MTFAADPQLSHVGIYVRDIDLMIDYYTRNLGLVVTDQGKYKQDDRIAFLSRSAEEHHQLVLASGRPGNAEFSTVNQISFRVASLDHLKSMHQFLTSSNIRIERAVSHGNAWSFYFFDPEGNKIEIYTPSEWYVSQPFGREVDFTRNTADLIEENTKLLSEQKNVITRNEWATEFERKIADASKSFHGQSKP